MLTYLIICHLVGDFLLQNHWMQTKSSNSFVCSIHVGCYSIPFIAFFCLSAVPLWVLGAIIIEHWFQDRFGLHLKWMKIYKQTPPDKWPVGPLCIDQSMHLAFIGLFYAIS